MVNGAAGSKCCCVFKASQYQKGVWNWKRLRNAHLAGKIWNLGTLFLHDVSLGVKRFLDSSVSVVIISQRVFGSNQEFLDTDARSADLFDTMR